MRKMFAKLWNDDAGFIISAELIFIATILVIGLVAGLAGLRNLVITELIEVGNAIAALDNGYTIVGIRSVQDIGGALTGAESNYTAASDLANFMHLETNTATGTGVGTAVVINNADITSNTP